MNPSHLFRVTAKTHRRVAFAFVQSAALALPFAGCSSTAQTAAKSAVKIAYQDAASPAGQKLLADVTEAALRVGLDLAAGQDSGAALAGIQGAASAVRDYEGLPAAPGNATVAEAAAAGSGVARVAATLAPEVRTLLENARQSAAQQNVHVSTDDLIEAVARGFDAVTPTQP